MGNRAVITVAPYAPDNLGIYVHWNGGRESIEGFMRAARVLGLRTPGYDPAYSMARLTQLIANFFGGTESIGIGLCRDLDCANGDNGVWLIGPDWNIVGGANWRQSLNAEQEAIATAIRQEIVAKQEALAALK